ncbi:NYN domain-containing protein [Neorhizobium sp. LjRoot104]|uniref:NYN domain-containing protein n=1 Tax=Neorhizobium sp. LjRoot104 TaxID=3342254 RepID=UPI003F50B880
MPLAQPPEARPSGYVWAQPSPAVVRVVKSEEKGSNVNLAAHLVRDAFTDAFDVAAIVTNDTDLVEPIRIAVQEAKKVVGLLAPVKYPSQSLMNVASFYRRIRPDHLGKSQFASQLSLGDGSTISKPSTWV